jgi:hypothetical protein
MYPPNTNPTTNIAHVRRRGVMFHFNLNVYLSGKYGEIRNSCLLLVENGMGVAT